MSIYSNFITTLIATTTSVVAVYVGMQTDLLAITREHYFVRNSDRLADVTVQQVKDLSHRVDTLLAQQVMQNQENTILRDKLASIKLELAALRYTTTITIDDYRRQVTKLEAEYKSCKT